METLLANLKDRTVRGLLMPWNELSRPSNIGPIMFSRDVLAVPADPLVLTANIRHMREEPVGRATALEDTDTGLVATFAIAKTPEGDQLLADISEGRLTRLSAEVKGVVRDLTDKTRATAGALFGAAFVDEGAFASAALYAELASEVHVDETYTDDQGRTWRMVRDTESKTETTDTGTKTTTTTTVVEEETEAAATVTTTQEETMPETLAAEKADEQATVPQTLMASAPQTQPAVDGNTIYQVAHAMAAYFRTGSSEAIEALAAVSRTAGDLMFAALSDVKTSGAGAAIIQPQWIGDVWKERTYTRKIVPLLGTAPLTSLKVKGFRFTTKAEGGDWAGDKAAVPSAALVTEEVSVTAARWAGGHDVAREFRDFDVPEFWVAYFAQMSNSYARWSDTKALTDIVAGSTPVVAGAVPAGANASTVLLVDGALSVIATDEAVPSFAIAATDVYRGLLLQNRDDIIATLSLSLGLESGDLSGFRIIPSAGIAAGKVLVGSRDAATYHELPGAPIRTEALDMVKGGIDTGFFGYGATVIHNAAALALVSPAA
ncbi:phage major capsid protein [Demequina capsici]|uniref:Major capsid protein n=1 Tax=Demequina capsici TaxID=3075620 RepID=A0AA96F7W6_9MICO|nr:hypothetical protein [Demequina sp. OYTSA14]WNM25239.1 hypothetical protein RN606_03570 [Demequina sp. OYTSA14]